MKDFTKACAFLFFMSAAAFFLFSTPGYAGKISDYEYIMKTEYASHQGVVTSIGSDGDYLLVSGRKIWLVEISHQGSTFATEFFSESGTAVDFGRIEVGRQVYVFGGGRRDNEIAAKDIFLLDGKLSDREFREFPMNKALRTWKSEVRAGQ